MEQQKTALYAGEAKEVVEELRRRWESTPKTGPGNKGKRERLFGVMRYMEKRLEQMPYGRLNAEDLALSSGTVEGQ